LREIKKASTLYYRQNTTPKTQTQQNKEQNRKTKEQRTIKRLREI